MDPNRTQGPSRPPARGAPPADGFKGSDQRFRDFLESAPDAVVIVDEQGRITLVNSQTERLFGYDRRELQGTPVEALVPDRFRAKHPEHRDHYIRDPHVRPMGAGLDLYARRKDGSEFPVEISLSPLRSEGKTWVTAIVRDITGRRKAEQKFRQLVESLPDAMVIIDHDGLITLVNAQTERLFGYHREELLGQAVEVLVPDRYRKKHPEYRRQYFANPRVRPMGGSLQLYGLRKDGSEFPVEISLSPIETEEGLLAASTIRDVSEQRRLESERLEANRLKEMNEFRARFINIAAHELKTPLTPIALQAQILTSVQSQGLTPAQCKAIAGLQRNVKRLQRLVEDILDAARAQATQLKLRRERFDLNEVLVEAMESYQPVAAAEGILLEWRRQGVQPVDGDRQRLIQVINNLLSNAIKVTPKGGRILVECGPREGEVVVRVNDSGRGLDAHQMARLFAAFSQVHGDLEAKGTGLGLYICKAIVEQHEGRIWAESRGPGQGSTFAFALPASKAEGGKAP